MSSLPPSFPPDLQQFVDDQIALGKYSSAEDVVCDAVRRLRDREVKLVALRQEIDKGLAQLDSGESFDLESENEILGWFDDIERQAQRRSAEQGEQ